jgi:hypothetical protein
VIDLMGDSSSSSSSSGDYEMAREEWDDEDMVMSES